MKYIALMFAFYLCAKAIHMMHQEFGGGIHLWIYVGLLCLAFFSLGVACILVATTPEYWDKE